MQVHNTYPIRLYYEITHVYECWASQLIHHPIAVKLSDIDTLFARHLNWPSFIFFRVFLFLLYFSSSLSFLFSHTSHPFFFTPKLLLFELSPLFPFEKFLFQFLPINQQASFLLFFISFFFSKLVHLLSDACKLFIKSRTWLLFASTLQMIELQIINTLSTFWRKLRIEIWVFLFHYCLILKYVFMFLNYLLNHTKIILILENLALTIA